MRVILKEAELEFDDKMCNVTTFHETRPEEIYKLSYNIQLYVELKMFFVKVGISLPNSNGMNLLLCYDNEGVYVNTMGRVTKNFVLQWGEMPTSVAFIGTGQIMGWGNKAIEVSH